MNLADVKQQYDSFKKLGLKLDMSRGKPSPEQLDLSNALLDAVGSFKAADGTDTRNYGGAVGLTEARTLFGNLLDVPAAQVAVDSSASLGLMHDVIAFGLLHGMPGTHRGLRSGRSAFCARFPATTAISRFANRRTSR